MTSIVLETIAAKCAECSSGSRGGVKTCGAESCPLWAYRFGECPEERSDLAPSEAVDQCCQECAGSLQEAAACTDESCPLQPYRTKVGLAGGVFGKDGKTYDPRPCPDCDKPLEKGKHYCPACRRKRARKSKRERMTRWRRKRGLPVDGKSIWRAAK